MAIKNKTYDRDHNGRIRRKYTGPSHKWQCSWGGEPKYWRKLFMTRPKRRENKRLCHKILMGCDGDSIVFPVGNGKPYEYYW